MSSILDSTAALFAHFEMLDFYHECFVERCGVCHQWRAANAVGLLDEQLRDPITDFCRERKKNWLILTLKTMQESTRTSTVSSVTDIVIQPVTVEDHIERCVEFRA